MTEQPVPTVTVPIKIDPLANIVTDNLFAAVIDH
jgi:hypothetical protein